MPRRIEIELTSSQSDGTWTWRAAGAKSPKGTLSGTLLSAWPAKVGDIVRADAEFAVEGIEIVAVQTPKSAKAAMAEHIEWIGSDRHVEGVVANVSKRALAEGDGRRERGPRGDRPDRAAGDRPGADRRGPRPGGAGRPDRAAGDRPPRGPLSERPTGERGPRSERPSRPAAERGPRRERPAPPPPAPRAKRLRAGKVHRNALLAELPEAERPIADLLFRGGIPAVRQALEAQNAELKAAGQPEVRVDALLKLAEDLNHKVRAADWKDRADAALAEIEELDLRDLRALVAGANDVALDEATREPATKVREALDRRVDAEHATWLAEISGLVVEGRIVRALKVSSRPVKAGARFPVELGAQLVHQASAALTAEATADRWDAVLEALALSPVRTQVTPSGIPATRSDALMAVVKKYAGRLPQIAAAFGLGAPTAVDTRPVPAPPAPPAPATPPTPDAGIEPAAG